MTHSFIIHCGAREVDFTEVEKSETPERTDTHYPVPHVDVVNFTRRQIDGLGYEIVKERHALYRPEGTQLDTRYFGLFTLRHPELDDQLPAIALRNAHDKAFSLQESFGNNMVICDNLMLTGLILAMQKHTKNGWLNFRVELAKAIKDKVERGMEQIVGRRRAYKETGLRPHGFDSLLMDAYRRKIVAPSALGKIHDEYHSEEHVEKHGSGTVFSACNAFTEVMKGRIVAYPNKSYKLTELMDEWANYREAA